MPDPQRTREWTPVTGDQIDPETGEMVPQAGEDERNREVADIVPEHQRPSREFSPSVEGGDDEITRGDEAFQERVADLRMRKDAQEELVEAASDPTPVNQEEASSSLLEAMKAGEEEQVDAASSSDDLTPEE
jgi:hypothetical protein